jgi:DNA (cytosine-5)-methyltransferase 1
LSFAEIVANVKPQFFVMENVDRIVKSKRLPEAIKIFRKARYGLSSKILDTSYCGVPQARKRYIMVGELNGPDNVLSYYFENNLALKPMTIREYFGKKLDFEHYYRHPRNYSRRAVYSIDEPSPTIRGVNRPVPKGYKGHPADSTLISKQIRPLTTVERSYIQTFPPEFKWEGNKSDLEQMIGNAVPVKLAEFVANCIKEYITDKERGESYIKAKVGGVLVFDKKKK